MNKMKRLSALVCAGALVMSTVPAYAAVTSNGNGGVENLGEQGISFDSIVLPTMTEGSYDFILDPQGLLESYGGDAYKADKTAYFYGQRTAAKLELVATGTLYCEKEAADATALTGALKTGTTLTADGAVDTFPTGYFVWVPDETKIAEGAGKYLALDKDNAAKYLKFTPDATTPTTVDSIAMVGGGEADNVCDGNVYSMKKVDVTTVADFNIEDYVTIENGEIKGLKADGKKLYSGAAGANEVTSADDLKYTPASFTYDDSSSEAKIINKSSSAKKVSVKVSVTNGSGLEFSNSSTFADKTKAGVYFAITGADGAGTAVTKAVEKKTVDGVDTYVAKAELTVAAPTIDNTTTKTYMNGDDDKTNGHKYATYLLPTMDASYKSATFKLTAAANGDDAAKAAWDAYAQSLRTSSTNMRPGITVVYDIQDDIQKLTMTDELKSTISWANDGWAWFDLGAADAPTKVQLVANPGTDDEAVYALKSSDYYMSDTFVGVNPTKAGGPQKLSALIEVGAKVYEIALW